LTKSYFEVPGYSHSTGQKENFDSEKSYYIKLS
jgi:hypothetical protein